MERGCFNQNPKPLDFTQLGAPICHQSYPTSVIQQFDRKRQQWQRSIARLRSRPLLLPAFLRGTLVGPNSSVVTSISVPNGSVQEVCILVQETTPVCMCLYIYMYICTYVLVYVCVHTCMCIYIYIYIYVCVYIYIHNIHIESFLERAQIDQRKWPTSN